MANHRLETRDLVAEMRAASDLWWNAHENGAPADVVEALWADLDRLCRNQAPPAPEDHLENRFGWYGPPSGP